MATYINNIFNFGRRLPSPFDTIANKKIKVSSKYGDGTTSTLCSAMIKAIHAVCHCMDGSGEGAVGIIDHRTAAEYKSSVSADAYHLVVYDSNTGTLLASVYDSNMETFENYTLNSSGRDGAAVMMALFPMLMQDDEFKENFEAYQDELNAGYPHMDKATEYMALMCDNAYRRIKDDSCAAHIKVNVDKAGNLMRVSQTHLDSGSFTPTTVLAGEFKIFAQTGPAQIYSATETIDHVDFEGQYVLNKRTFSPQEAMLIPKLPEWYIIPKEVVDICKHAKATTGKSMQMRNFLLRGPAGTGKTMGAKAIAAGLGLPYMKYTCSANTEIFDFVGMIFPDSADGCGPDTPPDRGRPGGRSRRSGQCGDSGRAAPCRCPGETGGCRWAGAGRRTPPRWPVGSHAVRRRDRSISRRRQRSFPPGRSGDRPRRRPAAQRDSPCRPSAGCCTGACGA